MEIARQQHNKNWISTIDVVGEHITRPDLVARHENFELSDGDVSITINTNERKLSDVHIPPHSHNNSDVDSPSYNRNTSRTAKQWRERFGTLSDFLGGDTFTRCELSGVRANVVRSLNNPPIDGRQMANVGSSRTISTTYRRGGGNIINDGVTNTNPNCTSDTGTIRLVLVLVVAMVIVEEIYFLFVELLDIFGVV
jgi:hypothetical protein